MKFGKTGVKLLKRRMQKTQKKELASRPPADLYRSIPDVDALSDGRFDHQLDIYYADNANRNHMTVLNIHGGAYIANTRKNNYKFALAFLEEGFDVVLLDYPLNDGIQEITEQMRVLAKQLAFVKQHAEEYDLDPEHFFLTGDSAGGHFALLLAEMICDPSIAKNLNLDLGGFSCRAVSASCPVYDLEKAMRDAPLNDKGLPELFGPSCHDPAYVRSISPNTYISSLTMPVFVNTCRNDFLLAHSQALEKDLISLGRRPDYVYIDEKNSKVAHVHNVIDVKMQASIDVNLAMMEFFRSV